MIKINQKYLKKIIIEEAGKVAEAQDEGDPSKTRPGEEDYTGHKGNISKTHAGRDYMDPDDLADFDKDDPKEWQDWDVIVSALSGFTMDKLKDTIEDPRDLNYVERQIEVPLLDMVKGLEGDVIEHLVTGFGGDDYVEDDQGPGPELNMDRYIADKGPLDEAEEKKMKIAKSKLARMIQEEINKVLKEDKPEGKGCAESEGGSGCIKKDDKGWFIWNNKKGGIFKRCKSKKDCEEILEVPGVHKG